MTAKLIASYRIRAHASDIVDRAAAIAVEQSVEMPVAAILDQTVLMQIVGRVDGISDCGDGTFDARVALNVETTGFEAGQLLNVLFGNSSIHDDVMLQDIELPSELISRFTGPRHGPDGLRARVRAPRRALTCSALKPQGMSAAQFADLASRLALGGLDYIKDDHGLADQATAPFSARVPAVAAAVEKAARHTDKPTRYLPNVSGNLDTLRLQVRIARDHGLDTLLIAPMIVGLASFQTLVRENADMAFVAHPAMAGASRIAPAALYGKMFRLIGADAVIFPNAGGRFGYSQATCHSIATTALQEWRGVKPSLPVPAGGMKLAALPAILETYGADAMLLIGGDLLASGDAMMLQSQAFQAAVETHKYVA